MKYSNEQKAVIILSVLDSLEIHGIAVESTTYKPLRGLWTAFDIKVLDSSFHQWSVNNFYKIDFMLKLIHFLVIEVIALFDHIIYSNRRENMYIHIYSQLVACRRAALLGLNACHTPAQATQYLQV